jgi:gamma-glutamylaminecyclotransferase
MSLVFVYGTLKRGGSNHHYLAGQSFVGNARTAPGFTLYNLGGYPGMVRLGDDTGGVSGEVWSVDGECLAGLDALEGTGEGLYRREAVPLGDSFAEQCVEAYIYLPSVAGRERIGSEWAG